MTPSKNKKTRNDAMVRLTTQAYEHAKKIVDALNESGRPTTMKGYLSSLILNVEMPTEEEIKSMAKEYQTTRKSK